MLNFRIIIGECWLNEWLIKFMILTTIFWLTMFWVGDCSFKLKYYLYFQSFVPLLLSPRNLIVKTQATVLELLNFFLQLKKKNSQAKSGKKYLFLIIGIVSRDWGELQMISMDRSEVFSIAGSYFYSFLITFSCLNL